MKTASARAHRRLGALGVLLVLLASACGAATLAQPVSTAKMPPALEAETVRKGRQVYVTSCAVCHGPNAQGAPGWQRPDDKGNVPPPPHDDSGHTWRHSDQQLTEIVLDGWRDPFNKTPELTMPPFNGKLIDKDVEAVITYFKSLWSDEQRRYQLDETNKAMSTPITPSP